MSKNIENAIYNEKLPSGLPWAGVIAAGPHGRLQAALGRKLADGDRVHNKLGVPLQDAHDSADIATGSGVEGE